MKGENNMEGKFLPIGSVVRLKDGQKRLMITGFLQMEQGENGQKNLLNLNLVHTVYFYECSHW